MTWELYEVWVRSTDGREDLIDTTKSLKEARELANINLGEDIIECVIYKETEEGDPIEVETVK
jgi:hypothetical protein